MTREEAINAITAFVENYASGNDLVGLRTAIEALKDPKKGEWDDNDKCSVCGHYCLCDGWGNEFHSLFCPNCGARMKEGDEKC